MKLLGENIRKLRQARGLTQQQLADKMGASNYTTISKWESGANSPRGGDLVELSKLFNVSVDELLGINSNVTIKSDYNTYQIQIIIHTKYSKRKLLKITTNTYRSVLLAVLGNV